MNPFEFTFGLGILASLILYLACAMFTSAVAESKGRSSLAWLIGGIFFGPVALLAAVGIAPYDWAGARAYKGKSGPKKVCGACRELMRNEASICPHCRTHVATFADRQPEPSLAVEEA